MRKITSNILNVLNQVNECDYNEGLLAYPRYNKTLKQIADQANLPLFQVAGVFAALSPNTDYIKNLKSCLTVCQGFIQGKKQTECTVATYNHNREKAWRILKGEHFYSVFKGLKVRNFWRNITEPSHPEAVTIDRHMVNVAAGKIRRLTKAGISKREYTQLKREFQLIAEKEKILPSQLQAVLWFTWKRINNIVYHGAGNNPLLFPCANEWNVFVPIEKITPYETKPKNKANKKYMDGLLWPVSKKKGR